MNKKLQRVRSEKMRILVLSVSVFGSVVALFLLLLFISRILIILVINLFDSQFNVIDLSVSFPL